MKLVVLALALLALWLLILWTLIRPPHIAVANPGEELATASRIGRTTAPDAGAGVRAPTRHPAPAPRASRHRELVHLLRWYRPLDTTCYVATGHRTASGVWPQVGMAASNEFPLGTRLLIEKHGLVTVTDRIGHGSELDLFYDNLSDCIRFGRQRLRVAVVK